MIVGFGGVRSRCAPRWTLARVRRVFGETGVPELTSGSCRRPSRNIRGSLQGLPPDLPGLPCYVLASRRHSSGTRVLRSAARLASLHRGSPRGLWLPTMALLGFSSRRLRSDRGFPSPIERDRRPRSHPRGGSSPPAGLPDPHRNTVRIWRRARLPFRALPSGRMGTGFPAPALLWLAAGRAPVAGRRVRFRASFPCSECLGIFGVPREPDA
jgi:hypothetical protein